MTDDGNRISAMRGGAAYPVPRGWRWACGALGLTLLAAGVAAVFIRNSDVGAVGLVGVGTLLLLVAIAGHLPSKIKFGETEMELLQAQALENIDNERQRGTDDIGTVVEVVKQVTAEAAREATGNGSTSAERDPKPPSEIEDRIVRELESAAPGVAQRLSESRAFESVVGEVLGVIAKDHNWSVVTNRTAGFTTYDFVVKGDSGSAAVEARLARPSMDQQLNYNSALRLVSSGVRGVVVAHRQRTSPSFSAEQLAGLRIGTIQLQLQYPESVGLDPDDTKIGARNLEKALIKLIGE